MFIMLTRGDDSQIRIRTERIVAYGKLERAYSDGRQTWVRIADDERRVTETHGLNGDGALHVKESVELLDGLFRTESVVEASSHG